MQPRRSFARWYLAQIDLRASRREEAMRQFEQIRGATPLTAALAPALLQFARLQIEAGKIADALTILGEAEKTNPAPQVREQINFESGRAMPVPADFGERRLRRANSKRRRRGHRAEQRNAERE